MRDLLVVDLEATCHPKGEEPEGFFSEIIEIGRAIVRSDFGVVLPVDSIFVRPTLFPKLSGFCVELTTITQGEVDGGVGLAEALGMMEKLFRMHPLVFCSYGMYDRNMIRKQCERFGLSNPFPEDHINLKEEIGRFYGFGKAPMAKALALLGMPLEGTHHRGGDDSRNIACMAVRMISDGWKHPLLERRLT